MSFFDRYTKVEFRIIDTDGVVLASAGDSIEVEEPKDYEGTNLILTRITNQENVPRHGFNFSYGDPETPYIFIKAAGYQLIQDLYEAKGNDAQAEYQFLATDVRDNSVKADIRYYLDFNTYERSWVSGEPRIQLTVINESISYKIKSRYETVVNLLASKDMDGNAITPLVMDENYWHAKVIEKLASLETGNQITFAEGEETTHVSGNDAEVFFVKLPHEVTLNDFPIQSYNGNAVFADDEGGGSGFEGFFVFDAPDDGEYKIEYDLAVFVLFTEAPAPASTNARLSLEYKVGETGTPVELHSDNNPTINAILPSGSTQEWGESQTGDWVGNFEINLKKGDNVYIFYRITVDGDISREYKSFQKIRNTFVNVTALTQPQTTIVRSIDIFEFINRTLEIISGQSNILVSDFYETNCGSKRWLTNGYQIRQYEADDRPPESSMEDLVDTLFMIDSIGWGYEKIGGEVKLRMEQSDYFYNDAEILKIDNVFSYKEEIADELIINQLIFQFQDYIEEELNTLDSFTTKAEYLTPIFTNFLKLEIFSEYIADAYSIEYTRRQQFNDSPTDSWKYDNNIFIVDWVEITGLNGTSIPNRLSYNASTFELTTASFSNDGVVTIPLVIPELTGLGSFSSSSGLNPGPFTVDTVTFDEVNGRTIINVNEATSTTSGLFEFTFLGGFSFKRPESNQAFETVNNLISPTTTYNLRMSMKRILMKHAKWINSGLNYKEATEVIQNTFYDRNKTLETQFRSGATCLGGDLNRILLQENDDLSLSDYQNFARYFVPLRIIYEGELSFEENDYIRKALNGQSVDSNNYGYLSIKNEEGTYTKVYPNEHIFKPISGKIEGNGYKKFE